MRSSAGSTKLLKPLSLSLLISIALSALGPRQRAPARCSIGSRLDQVWVPTLRPLMKKVGVPVRSEEHTSELQSLMRNSYAVFCLTNNKKIKQSQQNKRT